MNLKFKPQRLLTFSMVVLASCGYAQQVNLRQESMTLEQLFKQIKKQTGKDIMLGSTSLNIQSVIDINQQGEVDLAVLLNTYFNDKTGFGVKNTGNAIVIGERAGRKGAILGQVISKKTKLPLADVNLRINEMEMSLQKTDARGFFHVPTYSTIKEVQFSFIGYKKAKINTMDKFFYVIELEEEGEAIDDVVITGIYQRKKESFTGSAATYTAKELKMIGNQNVLQSLKTLDPAFQIMESNQFGSDPNRLPNIEINGKSSVIGISNEYGANLNQPLFILDGFESNLSVINDFSMDRIESITILKDATATAIYGSKAANGVIVVETKRPKPGELKINYSANTSFSFADLTDYNLMNAKEKLEFELKSGYYGVFNTIGYQDYEKQYYEIRKEIERGVDSYWLAEPLRTAFVHRQNISAEGGDKNLRYMLTLSYGKQPGVMRLSDRTTTSGNTKLIYRKGKLSFSNSLTLDLITANRETVSFADFANTNPYFRKREEDGHIIKQWQPMAVSFNPLWNFNNNNLNQEKSNSFTNNFEFLWDIQQGVNLRTRIGVVKSSARTEIFRSPFNTEFASSTIQNQGKYTESNGNDLNYNSDVALTFVRTLTNKHMINAVAGARIEQYNSLLSVYNASGFIDDEFTNPAFSFGYPEVGTPVYRDSKRRGAGFYLTTGYTYQDKYLFDGTLRSDGSSVYGSDKQFTTIWSTGIGWNMHKEPWFRAQHLKWLNTLKVRASIGNPGNQNFSDYIAMRIYRYNQNNRNPFGTSVILSSDGNPDLKWQKTLNKNVGMELVVFNNRLRIDADYYHKDTDPLLVDINVPSSLGLTSVPENMGRLLTKGFSLTANGALIQKEDFTWRMKLSMSKNKYAYDQLGNALDFMNNDNVSRNLTRYYDGASPTDLWAVQSRGIDPATGREIFVKKNGEQTFVHSYDDETVVGNSEPKISGVLGTSLYYKGFSASVDIRYRFGGQVFLQTLYEKVENISYDKLSFNQDKRALYDRWQQAGDQASFKAISMFSTTPMSSRFVADNNQLIGESFSLGYETNNKNWLKSVGVSSLMARAYMNDIFYVSSILNERGTDYPFARSVSFSLSLGF